MSNPDLSGPYSLDPRDSGRSGGGSRARQRGGPYGRASADAGGSGYGGVGGYRGSGGYGDGYDRGNGNGRGSAGTGSAGTGSGRGRGTRGVRRGTSGSSARDDGAGNGRQPWARSQPAAGPAQPEPGRPLGQSWDRGSARTGRGRPDPRAARNGKDMTPRDRLAARLGTGGAAAEGYRGPGQYSAAGGPARGRSQGGGRRGGSGGRNGGNGGTGGRDGNGRPRRKGDWWRHWSLKKALIAAVGTGVGGFMLLIALFGVAYAQTPIPVDGSTAALSQASVVYFRDGHTVVGTFGTTDRQTVTSIPQVVKDAVVAAEDKHFYHEGGVSPTGIIRAALADLTSGSVQQGGSTITQQFVRNYYSGIGTAQTMSRKVKEIFVAQKLASEKSKDWILTQYINTVLLGGDVYGFGAASQAYFGVPITKLDASQAAMLAAMIQSPNGFSPVPGSPGYSGLVFRWHYVLNSMAQMGSLSPKAAAAEKFPKIVKSTNNGWGTGYRGYIMQAVLNELETTYHYTQTQINTGGLHITTTFSKPMMDTLYATVRQQLKVAEAVSGKLPNWVHTGAVLEQPRTGQIWAMYSGPNFSASEKRCKHIRCQWDMALQNREQVGSSFKPYVLALARQQGMSVQTSTLDGYSPLWIPPVAEPSTYASRTQPADSAGWYEVGNDTGDGSLGAQSVVHATAFSLNTAYTDLYHRVAGTTGQNIVNMVSALGVNTTASGLTGPNAMKEEVGTALGQVSLTVEEQASTFATFANNGVYITPHVILKITQGPAMITAKVSMRPVLQPDEASDVDYALSFDTQAGGTAASAAMSDGREIIAKTGTTNLSQSAFFIGAIPQFSLAVGMFTNHQGCPASAGAACLAAANQESAPPPHVQTLYGVGGLQGYGGQIPATIWHAFAEKEFTKLANRSFPTPDFGGTAWDLLPPQAPKPTPTATCQGFFFHGHCHGNQNPNPNPNPTFPTAPGPNPTPSLPTTAPTLGAAVLPSKRG